MTDQVFSIIEWEDEEYELKYTFKTVQRLRDHGIDIPRSYREIQKDPERAGDFGDVYAGVAFHLLREAGCSAAEETVWRRCVDDIDFMKTCCQMFLWVVANHYAGSRAVQNTGTPAKKPQAKTKAKRRKS